MELRSKAFQVLSSNDNTAMESVFSQLYPVEQEQEQEEEEGGSKAMAMAFLECCKQHHPDLLFIKLFFMLSSAPVPETRANAARAILLMEPAQLWPKLKPIAQLHLKAHFLTYLSQETSIHVLRFASVVVSQILSLSYKTHQYWPELLDLLLSFMASNHDNSREVASLIFSNLPNDSRFLISNALRHKRPAVRLLHSSFLTSLSSSNLHLQLASFSAVVNIAPLFSQPSLFHDLLRALMLAVFSLLHDYESTYFPIAFRHLINLVSHDPLLLKPYISDMILDVLQITDTDTLNCQTHSLAFQLVVAMTDVKQHRHVFFNLPYTTARRLFLVPMKMLYCVPDDGGREFINEKALDDYEFGLKSLKKLSVALSASKALPVAFDVLQLHLGDAEWKLRHAGITMLTVIAEEFSDQMVLMENTDLVGVLTKVLMSMQDSHTQVRLATLKFLKTPTNFVQGLQILYHHRLVHAFCSVLDNEQVVKVKEQAASAMHFFLKNTLPDSLTLNKNVDTVMEKMLTLLQDKDSAQLRIIALTTLNIIAQRCHDVPHTYCAIYLPILLEACKDINVDIREEAARGIRIFAELGTPQLKPFVHRILPELIALMNHPDPSLNANDIAISAIGRICEFHRECIDGSRMVPAWLNFLPLKNDLIEAKIMHEQLCLMVARLDKDLFGTGNQNLAKIIVVLLEIMDDGDKLATAETIKQVNNLLRQLGRRIPRTAFDTLFNPRHRELLLSLLS